MIFQWLPPFALGLGDNGLDRLQAEVSCGTLLLNVLATNEINLSTAKARLKATNNIQKCFDWAQLSQ